MNLLLSGVLFKQNELGLTLQSRTVIPKLAKYGLKKLNEQLYFQCLFGRMCRKV